VSEKNIKAYELKWGATSVKEKKETKLEPTWSEKFLKAVSFHCKMEACVLISSIISSYSSALFR
jgi:hypothetical protein